MTSRPRQRNLRDEPARGDWLPKPETGLFWYTFTARLPFVLGISDGLEHEISVGEKFLDPVARSTFARAPSVRIRLFNADIADTRHQQANLPAAVERFYGGDLSADDDAKHRYEQWVSLQTPAAVTAHDNPTDAAYAFHRCLRALGLFLEALALSRGDTGVRRISARELRPIVFIGQLDLDGRWTAVGPMLMHPDARPRAVTTRSVEDYTDGLNQAIESLLNGQPFLRSGQWRARAERRKYEGDSADAIVSFQIAAETLAYELWALLLLDEGLSGAEVDDRIRSDTPYKPLLTHELSHRLGGSWDLTSPRLPVGRYWAYVYEVRNRIVHAGYLPHDGDSEQAELAYAAFEQFLVERTRLKRKVYPTAHAGVASIRPH